MQRPRNTILIASIGCAIALIVAVWPSSFRFATMCISLIFGHMLSIFIFNIVVMYVYVKYLIPPTRHQRQRDFRPLRFAHASSWPALQQKRLQDNTRSPHPPVAPNSTEISEAFEELLSYILRDFIDYWFVHVAGPLEISFRESIDRIIRSAALKLQQRIHETDLVNLLVNRLIPAVTQHISEFRTAEVSLRGRSLERSLTQSDELDLLLASQFRGGKLHSALTTAAMTTKPTEVVYLRQVIDRVLPYVIDPKELGSGPVRVIIRELVSCAVLQPVMDMIADPDFWNQTIDSYLGKAIREQKMVRKLREALNRHSKELDDLDIELMETSFGSMQSPEVTSPRFGQDQLLGESEVGIHSRLQDINMGRRTFQDFLRMIEEEKNLLELKRVRNDIVTQLRKKRALIHDRDPEEIIDGEKVEDIIVYLNRLSVAKKRTDKRIGVLTGDKKASRTQFFAPRRKPSEYGSSMQQPFGFSLNDILKNTAGLSYFMEFMDRRGDMMKLQFWLIVEGFKNPDSTVAHEQQRDDLTFLQDVKMVYEMYLSSGAPHRLPVTKQLDEELRDAIKQAEDCVSQDGSRLHETIQDMREKLYGIQQHVFWQLEKEHFPYFKRSDLYFKYLATTPNSAPDTAPERRSLDENRLYRRPSTAEYHTRKLLSSTEGLSAQPLERTTSDSLAKKKPWMTSGDNKKADSDTEVGESRLQKTRAQVHSEGSSRPARGHVRATSETLNLSVSRFFGRMTGDWWNISDWPSSRKSDVDNNSKRSSMHESIKSIDTDDLTEDEGAILEDNSVPSPDNGRQPLVRRNTLDAVEAELKSIIDNEDIEHEEKVTPKAQKRKTPPPPLLLYGTKGSKSSMALPVQNDYTLPTWKSSGGSNVIGEVQHDELDPVIDSGNNKSKTTQKDDTAADDMDTLADSETLNGSSNVHLAPPGDLMLAAQVEKLSEEMEKLMQQEAIVDVLISKAEAKNKTEELRILKKSKNMFRRELQQIKYQKSQYELQESENVLMPERTRVSIASSTIGSDESGEFALYVIEIQQLGADDNYASGWIVARRYSEFFSLHQKLKDQYPLVKHLEFPAKWPLLRLQKSFVEARRTNLERYLRRLVEDKDICKSKELRAFLSQQNVYVPGPEADTETSEMGFFTSIPLLASRKPTQHKTSSQLLKQQLQPSSSTSSVASSRSRKSLQRSTADNNDVPPGIQRKPSVGFMKHIYKTVAEGIDDMSIAPSMLDLITQRMGEQVMDFIQEDAAKPNEESVDAAAAAAAAVAVDLGEVPLPSDGTIKTEAVATTFTDPLCDLFIEMFELKDKNNWLRRQAVVIILQQILGGTIERKLRETVKFLGTEPMVVFYLRKITDSLWPDGQTLKFREARRPDEKQLTKEAANRKLSTWLPDQIGQMVGRQNARRGARRLFSVLQNKRLNQDLAYTLFDEIISALFPEIDFEKDTKR